MNPIKGSLVFNFFTNSSDEGCEGECDSSKLSYFEYIYKSGFSLEVERHNKPRISFKKEDEDSRSVPIIGVKGIV